MGTAAEFWNKMPMKWIVAIAIIASPFLVWKLVCPSGTWRYKVTVNIETPEGIKTGSAVREFSNCSCWIKLIDLPEVGNPPDNFKGEAVAVDLGTRGVLFAVMGTDDYYTYYNAFPVDGASTPGGILEMNAMGHREKTLSQKEYPLLVAFKDIKDPKTVTIAYRPIYERDKDKPGIQYKVVGVEDHMEKLFGKGVHLKDITVEITKESVTWGIERYLGWLKDFEIKGGTLSGEVFFNTPPSPEKILTYYHFKNGE